MSSPEPGAASRQQRAVWSPPTTSSFSSQQHHHHHPVSFLSTGSGGSGSANDSPLASPVAHSRGQSYFQGYSSPLPPNAQTQGSYASHGAGYMRNGSEGVPSVYVQDDQDDGTSIHSSGGGRDMRAQQAKRRLQMQMQMHQELDQQHQQLQQQHQRQQEEYARQLMLIEQQQARDEELAMQQQQQQQHQQRFLQKQQPLQHNPAVMMGALDYHMGGTPSNVSTKSSGSKSNGKNYASSMMTVTTESTVESHKSGSSGGKAMSVKSTGSEEKKKGLLAKMKPPKPKASGADLMKSAGF
ncbi:hypothetical protein BC939DRAFT_442813 [Gamsiella multidivaricata]|uniref:uncharacterized protein n=1 Tax=Gamsiella multidivaricata TaxID=101098 RepID=UPI0022200D1B|nr:uncharacterized protein BC939DRAFT_442813 [Gamsiella multidivaricata]KAI7828746.1 hypothetical protein BC939DRAFT_442813 [Gamsiella multidivaricata]